MWQVLGPHDVCVHVLQVPEALCLLPNSSPIAWDQASSPRCRCQPWRVAQREGDIPMCHLKLLNPRWPHSPQLSR